MKQFNPKGTLLELPHDIGMDLYIKGISKDCFAVNFYYSYPKESTETIMTNPEIYEYYYPKLYILFYQ